MGSQLGYGKDGIWRAGASVHGGPTLSGGECLPLHLDAGQRDYDLSFQERPSSRARSRTSIRFRVWPHLCRPHVYPRLKNLRNRGQASQAYQSFQPLPSTHAGSEQASHMRWTEGSDQLSAKISTVIRYVVD